MDNQIYADTYKGLHSFHKYWGKKPGGISSEIVGSLSKKNDIILDPFLGSGLLSRICAANGRRFVGIDINPISIELAKLFLDLPSVESYSEALERIKLSAEQKICASYLRKDGAVGTHFLWRNSEMLQAWTKNSHGRRQENIADIHDIKRAENYSEYRIRHARELDTFSNSRINSSPSMSFGDVFKPRACANIDILLESILGLESESLRRTFLLILTAASGQMSNFVFAIQNRKSAAANTKIEVGSWSVGFWRPALHFEVNVWNCFVNRANRMLKILRSGDFNASYRWTDSLTDFFAGNHNAALIAAPAQIALDSIPSGSADLIFTDPPHGDRIPYLELSEIWNSILQIGRSDFSSEIVISDAKERRKTLEKYDEDMHQIFAQCCDILKAEGYLVVVYNNSDQDWNMLPALPDWKFICRFDVNYSTGSLLQDSRKGSLRKDYAFMFAKNSKGSSRPVPATVTSMPGFSYEMPPTSSTSTTTTIAAGPPKEKQTW